MDLENALGELLVDLPADAGVPVVASAREGTWLWSDWTCRTPRCCWVGVGCTSDL